MPLTTPTSEGGTVKAAQKTVPELSTSLLREITAVIVVAVEFKETPIITGTTVFGEIVGANVGNEVGEVVGAPLNL